MRIIIGNLWNFDLRGNAIVIPGNIGWTKHGENVMSAGVAKEARDRYPVLSSLIGERCQMYGKDTGVMAIYVNTHMFIFFPVKPLHPIIPHLSWNQPASIDLVHKSCMELAKIEDVAQNIYLPLVGCGNGGLSPLDVYPILRDTLSDRLTLVLQQDSAKLFKEQGWIS